jgi:Protein of unknown function (DUF2711)
MATRILPEPELFAVCPNAGPVLSFYRGMFEAAYVLLHPFNCPVAMSVDSFLENPSQWDRAGICSTCEPVAWKTVQQRGGFSSLAEIDIALRTQIGALNRFENEGLVTKLQLCLKREGIVPPTEGQFSELTHDKVLAFLQEDGHSWVWVGDEFGTERKLHWIDDLKKPASDATEGHKSVFTADKSVLWTTHWDSHFSFVCGSNRLIDRLANDDRFEGFRCDEGTEVYWSLQTR